MTRKIALRASPYDYDTNAAGNESALNCQDKTRTQQHLKDECDINVLVQRFVVTGEIPALTMPPLQGDFTDAPTYQDALNLMVQANRSFMQQPAEVRARFMNDPAQFVDYVSNPDNRQGVRELGLWSKEANDAWDRQQAQEAAYAAAGRAAEEKAKATPATPADTPKGVS
ncbi:MAG: internal scaffolding protein [Microviridae sp.]|nr:MAG: internal scaffolding protein [Microviridae sp.]